MITSAAVVSPSGPPGPAPRRPARAPQSQAQDRSRIGSAALFYRMRRAADPDERAKFRDLVESCIGNPPIFSSIVRCHPGPPFEAAQMTVTAWRKIGALATGLAVSKHAVRGASPRLPMRGIASAPKRPCRAPHLVNFEHRGKNCEANIYSGYFTIGPPFFGVRHARSGVCSWQSPSCS